MADETDLFHVDGPVPQVAAPLAVRDVVLDPTFGKRRDALLRTIPVHDIAERAARSDSGLTSFDVRALALSAFDAVIARQGFPDRTTPDQVLSLLSGIAAVQDPTADAKACTAVAEHVLDGLTNRRERERLFTYKSAVYREGERNEIASTSVARPFWLLREQEDSRTGELYLEASSDAINTLVGALDMRIEDQQAALEIVLERQLARGDLNAAHATAVAARGLTAAYIAQTDELLAETERHLPGTDWKVAGPRLISQALDHVSECLTREGRLLEHIGGGHDERTRSDPASTEAGGENRAKVSFRLTKLLQDSRHLHTALMERLIGARGNFLDAQDRQMFRATPTSIELDLTKDLLIPTLALRNRDAAQVAEEYLCAALGPKPPVVFNWGDFVDVLFAPPQPLGEDGEEPDEGLDVEFRPDPVPLVSRDLLETTRRILATVPLPARLSTLLNACPSTAGTAANSCDLVSVAALRGYDNADHDPGSHQPEVQGGERPAFWVSDREGGWRTETGPVHLLEILGPDAACHADGSMLTGPGWAGDDLIVCVDRDQLDAILLGQLPVPSCTPLPARPLRGT